MPTTRGTGYPIPADAIPVTEIAEIGPVVRHNHVAYVPWANVAHAPGTGTGNLAYIPDFLLSAPEYFAGNATKRVDNVPVVAQHSAMVTGFPTVLQGIGGLQAGQLVSRPLLGMQQVGQPSAEIGELDG
jgi:hypothetical protein